MPLHDLAGTKATVVVFLSFECPISTSYSPVLAEMAKRYAAQGVAFVGICASEAETAESVAKQAGDFKFGFPVLQDSNGDGGRRLQGRKDARGLRARSQLRAALPRPHRRRLCRPPQEEPADQEPRPGKGARRAGRRQSGQPAARRRPSAARSASSGRSSTTGPSPITATWPRSCRAAARSAIAPGRSAPSR